MNNKNKEILRKLANMFIAGCGTPRIMAIEAMGRDKWYAERNKKVWNLFNELDKTSLPEKEIKELEEALKIEEEIPKLKTGELSIKIKEGKIKGSEVYDACCKLLEYC